MSVIPEGQLDALDLLEPPAPVTPAVEAVERIECPACASHWGIALHPDVLTRSQEEHTEVSPGVCRQMLKFKDEPKFWARKNGSQPRWALPKDQLLPTFTAYTGKGARWTTMRCAWCQKRDYKSCEQGYHSNESSYIICRPCSERIDLKIPTTDLWHLIHLEEESETTNDL